LLEAAGITFRVEAVNADETPLAGELPEAYVERIARAKVELGAKRHPGAAVLGADTTVAVGDEILAKPADDREASEMLAKLSGRAHRVFTGIAVSFNGVTRSMVERTEVWFSPLTPDDIQWYVRSGEPHDRAGAYAIQGLASRFIPRIDGSYSNVVGLPVAAVVKLLKEMGILPADAS
jgi:septum formation protein